MKRVFPKLAAIAVAFAMCLGAPALNAQVSIYSSPPAPSPTVEGPQMTITPIPGVCPAAVIVQSGNYALDGDVGPCPPGTDGIDIEASDVTLHLNGHSITGTACTPPGAGIRVGLIAPAPMLSHVHVLGPGAIRDFVQGLFAQNSAGSFVKFVTFTCATGIANGFSVNAPGGQWEIQGNVVRQGVPKDSFCSIVLAADDNNVVRNDVNSPFCLIGSSGNTIVNNTANGGALGMLVGSGSNNNEFHANTTNDNNFVGLEIDSTGNNMTGNTSFNNLLFDMFDGNPDCDSNKWQGNHFNTTNQPQCVH